MAQANRPLSPHLQVYRWSAAMAASILHRATGSALAVGAVILVWWLMALASGPDSFETVMTCLASPLGRFVLFGLTWALMQHFASGVRHLIMDSGRMYSLKVNAASAKFTFVFSAVATVVIWAMGYRMLGMI
ncbi:succinate dehydrogenase, cytochrome b556 subunit [Pseudokordiimonas caeni]|uniref:succinate dehydrogenase, cytochrome b556 subunit n=1 Tax=Pseudokordiimonas caeni TaxID=2997908 RepID=UPI002811E826|nr:succinate dehydrogenase, cytochrome b556 subunit [Pseudokordiimonas caeni]